MGCQFALSTSRHLSTYFGFEVLQLGGDPWYHPGWIFLAGWLIVSFQIGELEHLRIFTVRMFTLKHESFMSFTNCFLAGIKKNCPHNLSTRFYAWNLLNSWRFTEAVLDIQMFNSLPWCQPEWPGSHQVDCCSPSVHPLWLRNRQVNTRFFVASRWILQLYHMLSNLIAKNPQVPWFQNASNSFRTISFL